MSFGNRLANYCAGSHLVDSFRTVYERGIQETSLHRPCPDPAKQVLLKRMYTEGLSHVNPRAIEALRLFHNSGYSPDPNGSEQTPWGAMRATIEEVTIGMLSRNRSMFGRIEPLAMTDYFALTPHTPQMYGSNWEPRQVLINSPSELLDFTKLGISEMLGNTIHRDLSSVAMGYPIAGEASRALAFAMANPGLVERIRNLGGLDGLEDGHLPPRFLYPIATQSGTLESFSLMLNNFLSAGSDLGLRSLTISMLNPKSSDLVLSRLSKDLRALGEDQLKTMLGFVQSSAPRLYMADGEPTDDLFVTGHGDFPNSLSRLGLISLMGSLGIEYFLFGNADEFLWGGDPTFIGIAKSLFDQGYSSMVVVVPNSNGMRGGGPVKETDNPSNQFLCETPCLPEGSGIPLAINTTFYAFSVPKLASVEQNLLTLQMALDTKTGPGRKGGLETVLCAESWAGTELTNPSNRPDNYKIAFVFAPRPGVFLGIKTLKESHGDDIPPEVSQHPRFGNMSYREIVSHMANLFPQVIQGLTSDDKGTAQAVFDAGYSYLIR